MSQHLTMAQVTAALWCEAVKRQAEVVAGIRRDLEGEMARLENLADIAERAFYDARAIKVIQEHQE